MFGTLSVTKVNSDDPAGLVLVVELVFVDELVFAGELVGSATGAGVQPARVIANPAASNTGANRFMSVLLEKK